MSIIKSRIPFKESFVPPTIADREGEVLFLKVHLKPLANQEVQPIGLHIVGGPGTGKTVTVKVILENFMIKTVYINMNMLTRAKAYQTISYVLDSFGLKRYGSLEDLKRTFVKFAGETPFALVLDEVDACPSQELGQIIHFFSRSTSATIIVISQRPDVLYHLNPDVLAGFKYRECLFKEYSSRELFLILKQRRDLSLHKGTCSASLLKKIAEEAAPIGSARYAIDLLAEVAALAEEANATIIEEEFLDEARINVEKNLVQKTIANLPLVHRVTLSHIIHAFRHGEKITTLRLYRQVTRELKYMGVASLSKRKFYEVLRNLNLRGLIQTQKVGRGRGRGVEYHLIPDSSVV